MDKPDWSTLIAEHASLGSRLLKLGDELMAILMDFLQEEYGKIEISYCPECGGKELNFGEIPDTDEGWDKVCSISETLSREFPGWEIIVESLYPKMET
ncbi:MAG: hypothetical protein DDT19_00093 [Syntrophomonadaceae bacterium]|nr:hypothetical protein [Bacillota bacterium]